MEKIYIKEVKETVYKKVLPSGLTCYFYPKDYNRSFFMMGINYGGAFKEFKYNNIKYSHPGGVAHFLEHVIFAYEGKDVLDTLASFGAQANAFTSNFETIYYFSTTYDYLAPLDIFIKFIFRDKLEIKDLSGEKQIIAQEIAMHANEPLEEVTQLLLDNLIVNHPVKEPILGRISDLDEIDEDTLNLAYQAFYKPNNACFIACGNIDIDKIMDRLNKIENNDMSIGEVIYPKEPINAKEDYIITKIHSETTYVLVGCKLPDGLFTNSKYILVVEALCYNLFTKTSSWTNRLIDLGLIFDDIGFYIDLSSDIKYFTITFLANDYQKLVKEINSLFNDFDKYLDSALFDTYIKASLGREIPSWDSLDDVASELADCYFEDEDISESIKKYYNLTFEDLITLKKSLKRENATIIVGLPNDK